MGSQFSRRDMLRGSLLAGASLPLIRLQSALHQWRAADETIVPGSSGAQVVRLSHNENPYGPSEKARKALIASLDQGNRYPRQAITELKQKIADYENILPEQILISAGSTELLGVAGLMAGMHEGKLISCHPTFPTLMYYGSQFAAEWVKVPLTEDHHYNLAGINNALDEQTNLVFICNPNNPTGTELPRTMLEPFCNIVSQRCTVYVDEAYIELSAAGRSASLIDLTKDNPQIIIARTFSKIYGMAGLRVGYAVAHPETIQRMEKLMMGGNITPSIPSCVAAGATLGEQDFMDYCKRMNDEAKEMTYAKFNSWGIEYIPSATNFIFFRTDRFGDTNLSQALAAKNVMIRMYDYTPGWARVSMGTHEEMGKFFDATEALLI